MSKQQLGFINSILFKEFRCMKCKQGYKIPDTVMQQFSSATEMWQYAKKIHKEGPVPCILPELVIIYENCLISAAMLESVFSRNNYTQ